MDNLKEKVDKKGSTNKREQLNTVGQIYGVEEVDGVNIDVEEQKLRQRYNTECQKLNAFVRGEYQFLDYKVNRCILKCYRQADNLPMMTECKKKCEAGSKSLAQFIQFRVEDIMNNLKNCLEQSNSFDKVKYEEAIKCYNGTIDYFKVIKTQIKEEAQFYQ